MNLVTKGERTRAEIVECAKKLFYEHGFDGTSFSVIVEATGLFRGNIYHYFRTKDEILEAVVEQRLGEFRAMLTQWDAEHADPKARLLAFVAMITGRTADVLQFGCPIGSLNTELGKDRRDLQLAARSLFDLFRDWLAACLRDLGRRSDAEPMALHLLGRAQGIAVIAHAYRDAKLLRRETAMLRAWIRAF